MALDPGKLVVVPLGDDVVYLLEKSDERVVVFGKPRSCSHVAGVLAVVVNVQTLTLGLVEVADVD